MQPLKLNKLIYKKLPLEKSIMAFKEIAQIQIVREDGQYYYLEILKQDSLSKNTLIKEFYNYALGMIKKCR